MRFRPLLVFPTAMLALHLAALPGYGWVRYEFYYLACSEGLDFGWISRRSRSCCCGSRASRSRWR